MNHRKGRLIFAVVVGVAFAVLSYRWASDPVPKMERERQERAVVESRRLLADTLSISDFELVDPLTPNRKVGKVYIYPIAAVYWGVKGDFVDFWDAMLWLIAFVFIELNVFEWRQITDLVNCRSSST